jgi:pimeloyl-ACP methyl ester carboxylesterase
MAATAELLALDALGPTGPYHAHERQTITDVAGHPLAGPPIDARLFHEERGRGSAVLLIHGTGASGRTWGPLPDDLARDHRVILYDRRGFSRSGPRRTRRLRDHVVDAAGLLASLNAQPATIVGWSMGGVIALGLAIQYPGAVASVVVIEPPLHSILVASTSSSRALAAWTWRVARRDYTGAMEHAYRDWIFADNRGGSAFDRLPDDWRDELLANSRAGVREMLQNTGLYPSRRSVRSISQPLTLVRGTASDRWFDRLERYLTRLLPHARVVGIEGGTHALHVEEPEQLAAAIRATSQEQEPGSDSRD